MSETLSHDDLDATAGELVAALAARRLGALELTDAAIARIEQRDGALNAVVVRDFERARAAARAADAALARGERRPLLGLPMTVKESHNVAGLPTTWGFDFGRGFIAPEDSVGVARLKAAGAVILGKTNVPVGLADWQSVNPIYGRTRNPWDLERSPGGSSGGGAAALAAGLVPLEFGSDIGGSIRVPAAFCGVFGHKPSYELIPQRGHAPPQAVGPGVVLGVVGPLARSAADLALALDVLAGPDEGEAVGYRLDLPPPRGTEAREFRVLLLDALPDVALDEEVAAALHAVGARLEALGARVAHAGAESIPEMSEQREVYSGLLQTALSRGNPTATPVSAHRWLELLDRQWRIRAQWAALFRNYDVVLAPAHGTPAFPHDDSPPEGRQLTVNGAPTPYFAQIGWASLATLGNLPATAAPVGQTRGGLPIGLQAIGPYLEDRTTLAFAALLEREFGGAQRPPRR